MHDALLLRSQESRTDYFARESERIHELVEAGQAPKMLLVGCCDSRVVPEYLLGARLGDLFIVRTVANICPPVDSPETSVQAAIEFGIGALGISDIVVLGHTDCGGVRAVEKEGANAPDTSLHNWLRHAHPILECPCAKIPDAAERHIAMVEENVKLQIDHLRDYPVVAEALKDKRVTLHGWVFDIHAIQVKYYHPGLGRFKIPQGG